MKAKKVFEMIDPYTSEEDAMDLDISYKKKLIEDWFSKWAPDADYIIEKNLDIIVFEGLYLNNSKVDVLPNNLMIEGDLSLDHTPISILPENLTVTGYLDLEHTLILKLPDNLTIGESLFLDHTPISTLPENLTIGGYFSLRDTKITSIPKSLKVKGGMYKDF